MGRDRKGQVERARQRLYASGIGLLVLGLLLCTGCSGLYTAERIQLMKTKGEVDISNSRGKEIEPVPEMKLYSGYDMATQRASYAWINLDSVKLAKMDASSQIHINKKRNGMEVVVEAGKLFFNIKEPLREDETLDIRTSNMSVGIRGTCGWVEVLDQEHMRVYILEGTVQCTVKAPRSRERKEVMVSGGQMAELTIDPEAEKGQMCKAQIRTFSEEDIDLFVWEELEVDEALCEKIREASGLEIQGTGEGTGGEDEAAGTGAGIEADGAGDGVKDDDTEDGAETDGAEADGAESDGAEDEAAGDDAETEAAETEAAGADAEANVAGIDVADDAAGAGVVESTADGTAESSAGEETVGAGDTAEAVVSEPVGENGWRDAYLAILEDQRAENATVGANSEMGAWDYQLYDIDKNGVPELILHFGVSMAGARANVYTCQNGEAVLVREQMGTGHTAFYTWPGENGMLSFWGHMGSTSFAKVSLVDGQLTFTQIHEEEGGTTSVDQIVPGAQSLSKCKIDQDTLINQY